jgi:hypothetical protein
MVLKARSSSDRVASLGDCLAIGPVPGLDWAERIAWFDDIDPAPADVGSDWMKDSADRFLADIRSHDGDRLVWIAPQSACEQCGLQYYFEQFPDASPGPMVIVDGPLSLGWRNAPPIGLGELPDELMARLLDEAPRREWPKERATPEVWRSLRADGGLLRIVEGGELRSAAPDHFDDFLVDQASGEWRRWSRLVGHAMGGAGERGHYVSDVYLIWRLRELVRLGWLECEGTLPGGGQTRSSQADARLRRKSG